MATPITDASFPEGRGETFQSQRIQIADGVGLTTNYHILNPAFQTSISMNKNGETATVETTISDRKLNGDILDDLENADVIWDSKSTGTVDYNGAGTYGLTGIRVVSTPVGADVDYFFKQTK